MPHNKWFRNEHWNPAIEKLFFEKLQRVRNKAQYLRIQADYLTRRHPKIALALLEKYFALGENWDETQGLLQRARVFLCLGKKREAIQSLVEALVRGRQFPNVRTEAWSEYALLIAREKLAPFYDDALRVLEENEAQAVLPVEQFRSYAARALISDARGERQRAKAHAARALRFGEVTYSGFAKHPTLGLVEAEYETLKATLRALASEYLV